MGALYESCAAEGVVPPCAMIARSFGIAASVVDILLRGAGQERPARIEYHLPFLGLQLTVDRERVDVTVRRQRDARLRRFFGLRILAVWLRLHGDCTRQADAEYRHHKN